MGAIYPFALHRALANAFGIPLSALVPASQVKRSPLPTVDPCVQLCASTADLPRYNPLVCNVSIVVKLDNGE